MAKKVEKVKDPELEMLSLNKESAYNYRQRRHDDWEEIYLLYRGKTRTNRLTQRQSVTLPLMKMTIKTILKDNDDMPVVYFENLDNDKDAEIFQNEYWQYTISPECNSMEIKDIVDKRQEMLYGRTFDQMQIVDGKISMTIEDPEDMLVDRFVDPSDLDTARFLIHTHIFRPLAVLANDDKYDQEAIKRLQEFYATKQGIIKAAENMKMLQEKNKKMSELGVPDIDSPVLGETYVELSLHFVYREGEKKKGQEGEADTTYDEQLFLYVEADDQEILMKKPLEEVIGTTKDNYWRKHFPYNSWADDVERQDFWSDSIGDIVRVPNKLLNIWYSQLVENRTLRSFGMNYYDSTIGGDIGWNPPNIDPEPWGWVGVPGDPNKVFKKVDVPDLSESLDEMEFVIGMNDRATGATATQQGVPMQKQITLGEVRLALNEAKERSKGMSKFYTQVWLKRAEKFLKMIEAAPDKLDAVKIYKKGRNTSDIYAREISPKDWMTGAGYRVKIWSQEDKDAQDTQQLEKLSAVRMMIPGNAKLEEILQRKALEFADLKPEEINDIITLENEKRDALANMPPMPGAIPGQPGQPAPSPSVRQPARPQPPMMGQ